MADVAYAKPFSINNAQLTLGTDTFPNAIGECTLTPNYAGTTYPTIDGDEHPIADQASWVLSIGFGQDHVTAGALSLYVLEHDGEVVPFVFTPQSGGQGYSGNVLIRAAAIGGNARQHATSSVQLPVKGQPTVVPAA